MAGRRSGKRTTEKSEKYRRRLAKRQRTDYTFADSVIFDAGEEAMPSFERVRSGLPGFDAIVDSIRMGDNVVWQLADLEEYLFFVEPFVAQRLAEGRTVNYMRFADHPPLLTERPGVKIWPFDPPEEGFESFTVKVHEVISREGGDAFYVFDCLSDLQTAWASDLMMGNFFQVTCPYLFELNTVAFFAILRNFHSFETIARIRDTTQLLLDVFSGDGARFVHPLKVWNRYGQSMFLPHRILNAGAEMRPLTDSVEAGQFYTIMHRQGVNPVDCSLDNWDRIFLQARQELAAGRDSAGRREQLCTMLIGRDARIRSLVMSQFTIADFLQIKERMIGSGAIGGKAVGVLLARKIIENNLPEQRGRIEPHDSFYIGADVFYSFLVANGWWKLRLEQRTEQGFFSAAGKLREKIVTGSFAAGIREQFRRMLDYFGQSPIIVRSSSLLEDGFGNAFAGKYESVFCVNAASPDQRLELFEAAVRRVYASAMDDSALAYRRQRRLDKQDEQMAILVQRVSGSGYGDFFLPCAAGVGYSYNSYVWHDSIDPDSGMLRLVAGLGTRAVDRTESDYPRIVSLDAPERMPVAGDDDRARFSQKYLDVLDLRSNALVSKPLAAVAAALPDWLKTLLFEHDAAAEAFYRDAGNWREVFFCNCGKIVANPVFIQDMSMILKTLQDFYRYPVDIEFTANFSRDNHFVINLLQCRPLQIRGQGAAVAIPAVAAEKTLFVLQGNTMGGGADFRIDYVINVDCAAYYEAEIGVKYQVARVIGEVNRRLGGTGSRLLLLGPGRWGTSSPELGVPVSFAEISNVAAIGEVSYDGGHIMPELSFGSHFFQDLVENAMFYAAIFENQPGCSFRPALLAAFPAAAAEGVSKAKLPPGLLTVRDTRESGLQLKSDILTRRTVCALF